jgi:hypothetical protein
VYPAGVLAPTGRSGWGELYEVLHSSLTGGDGRADDERVDLDAEGEPVVAVESHRSAWWRRHLIGVVSVTGFALLAGWGIGYWVSRPHSPDYSGQSRVASLDFDCLNRIFWTDPKSKYMWWTGDSPVLTSDFDTSPTTPGDPPYHHSTGTLHFDTEVRATFTSTAGGQLILSRQPLHQFYNAGCRVS